MTSWHLILAIFFLLLGFGLLMVLSASSIASFHNNGGSPFATFKSQAVFAVIGLGGFVFASKLSVKILRTYSFLFVAISLLMLAVVLVSRPINGARSWIMLGPINFQPSEIGKLAMLIWMGHVLAARRNTLRSMRALLIPVLPVFVIMVALIMLEPDLGTTVTLGLIFIAVMWFGGAPWWMFALLTGGAGALVAYLATSAGYRSLRIAAWLHPGSAPAKAVYQINQSLYGLGHGGIFGAGLGQSISKTGWLPNADSDFIFAIIGEELGLIGAGLVLLLFGLLAYTGLRIARRNVDPFIKIVASAATIWLVGQAAINIGYVIGLLPVTGIPLPMISRGGTSLVITMVVFGLLANFARREPQAAAALRSEGPGRMARFLGLGPSGRTASKPPKPRPVRSARGADGARPGTAERDRTVVEQRPAGRSSSADPDRGSFPARRSPSADPRRGSSPARGVRNGSEVADRRGSSPARGVRNGSEVADRRGSSPARGVRNGSEVADRRGSRDRTARR